MPAESALSRRKSESTSNGIVIIDDAVSICADVGVSRHEKFIN